MRHGRRALRNGLAVVATAGLLLGAAPAEAQDRSDRLATAQALYERAGELIRAGNWAEACPKLEESQRLDPAMGTQFYLASCYESTGRLTAAWSLFLEVAAAAKAAGNTVREKTARGRAAGLEPRLPRLTLVVPERVAALPGLEVLRDGAVQKPVVWGTAVAVELGAHRIRVTAPGKRAWEQRVELAERARAVITVPALADGAAEGPPDAGARPDDAVTPPDAPPHPPRMPATRVAGLAIGGVGVAGLVAGGVLGGLAGSTWTEVESACPSHVGCSAQAHQDSKRALTLATGSTIAFIGGGVAVGTALVLWSLPASRRTTSLHVSPIAGSGLAGVTAGGVF